MPVSCGAGPAAREATVRQRVTTAERWAKASAAARSEVRSASRGKRPGASAAERAAAADATGPGLIGGAAGPWAVWSESAAARERAAAAPAEGEGGWSGGGEAYPDGEASRRHGASTACTGASQSRGGVSAGRARIPARGEGADEGGTSSGGWSCGERRRSTAHVSRSASMELGRRAMSSLTLSVTAATSAAGGRSGHSKRKKRHRHSSSSSFLFPSSRSAAAGPSSIAIPPAAPNGPLGASAQS
mmetsp:Transcript_21809/g.70464  ORF Transcript_21809/g.70464 Transcript_21809/m.70464 type:complete len:245 (-) Transcript_21809:604-1338(-)